MKMQLRLNAGTTPKFELVLEPESASERAVLKIVARGGRLAVNDQLQNEFYSTPHDRVVIFPAPDDTAELRALLKQAYGLIVKHHEAGVRVDWGENCPFCSQEILDVLLREANK